MNNYEIDRDNKIDSIEKKLDALISALGFEVEIVNSIAPYDGELVKSMLNVDYKLVKRKVGEYEHCTNPDNRREDR